MMFDVTAQEAGIDRLVYGRYGLTAAESKTVEGVGECGILTLRSCGLKAPLTCSERRQHELLGSGKRGQTTADV